MKRQTVFSILFLVLVLTVLYLPVAAVVAYSFNANPSRNPIEFTGFTTRWYVDLFSGSRGYGDALWVSIRVAVMSTLLAVGIGTLGAVGMSRQGMAKPDPLKGATGEGAKKRGAKPSRSGITKEGKEKRGAKPPAGWMESLITLPIMIPEIILAMAFMSIFSAMGLPFGELTLVIAHTTFCIPYLLLTVKSRLVGMDPALFDAARDLGANPQRVLWDITLPLVRPAIISGGFLAFAMSMDDFIISFFVTSTTVTLPVKIYSSVRVGVSPQINALCTLMIAVVFLAVAISQYLSSMRNAKLRKPTPV